MLVDIKIMFWDKTGVKVAEGLLWGKGCDSCTSESTQTAVAKKCYYVIMC